jgi:hypothetical protein
MTIRSFTSTQRWTNQERLDKEQDSRVNDSCRKGERNDRFPARILPTHDGARHVEGRNFKGRSGDCLLHEQIVILSLPAKCYQKDKGLVSTSSRCIKNTEPVLSSSRPSPIVVSSWSSFPNTQT